MSKKRIAILGSTGSIGKQTLDIVRVHPDKFSVEVLTAAKNSQELIQQAKIFKPDTVVIADDEQYDTVADALADYDIKVFSGQDSISQVVEHGNIDMVLNAIVGFAGFEPTVRALRAGKPLALANKESIVVGGDLVTRLVKENRGIIIPVDSEHSAIFQCLVGESADTVEKIYLTASGGPFRKKDLSELENVSPGQALNWK